MPPELGIVDAERGAEDAARARDDVRLEDHQVPATLLECFHRVGARGYVYDFDAFAREPVLDDAGEQLVRNQRDQRTDDLR